MNSKERVESALTFAKPDKIPVYNVLKGDIASLLLGTRSTWKPGWLEKEKGFFPYGLSPMSWKRPNWAQNNPLYEGSNWKKIPHEEVDEWGRIWLFKGSDIDKGHPGRPTISSVDEIEEYLKTYSLDASDKSRFEPAIGLKMKYSKDLYNLVHLKDHGPCQLVSGLLGFSNFLIYHKRYPEALKKLLYTITNFHIQTIENSFKYGLNPDGFWLTDDLGEQNGPYFSPQVFETFYQEAYKPIFEKAHQYGAHVHLHSCGKIDKLLPFLIDWGLDAIELDSPRMSGYNDLAPYRGKIFFWGCVNIQSIYVHSTPEEVEREVWHMMRNLGTKDGGYGAFFYPTPKVLRVPRKNIKAFEEGVKKYGDYSNIPANWWNYPVSQDWENLVPALPPAN